jgi:hypothetical protein
MAITISNLTISNNAAAGTIVGVLTARDSSGNPIPCEYRLSKGSAGHFAISGNNLTASWGMVATPGYYSVRVRAIGINTRFSGAGTFTIIVGTPALPPPPPPPGPSITVNGSANAVVAEGSTLTLSIANGPGNRTDWVSLAAAGTADTAFIAWVYLSGLQTPPNAGMTAATIMMTAPTTDASYEARFYVDDSYTVLKRTSFTVRGAASAASSGA